MATYTVGDSLTLTCVVEPMPNSTSTVTYLWTCSDCFAAGMTVPNITRVLTDMEDDDIDCTVTIDGVGYMTDMMFALQVTQGSCAIYSLHYALCVKFVYLRMNYLTVEI